MGIFKHVTEKPFQMIMAISFSILLSTITSVVEGTIPTESQQAGPANTNINFFIENSGSMNGYVNGATEFKELISVLIVDLRNLYNEDSLNIIFINEIQRSIDQGYNLVNFASSLSPGLAPYRVSAIDRPANTFFDEILNNVLNQTDSTTVSILVSDCIYSSRDGRMGPEFVQPRVLDIFWKKLSTSKDFATVVYKLNSRFSGYYYSESRPGTNYYLDNVDRPYYLWLVGPVKEVETLINEVESDIRRIKGYESRHIFSTEKFHQNLYWTILTSTGTNALIKPDNKLSDPRYIRGITSINTDRRSIGPLTLAIALDFSSLLIDDDYLLNTGNYEITGGGNWVLDYVGKINHGNKVIQTRESTHQIMASDWIRLEKSEATHVLFFSNSSKSAYPGNLQFSIRKKLPEWIELSNTNDDSSVGLISGKTLLIKPILQGVNDAYGRVSKDTSLFSLSIPIRTTSGSNIGKTIFTFFLIALVIAVPALIIYNRKNS